MATRLDAVLGRSKGKTVVDPRKGEINNDEKEQGGEKPHSRRQIIEETPQHRPPGALHSVAPSVLKEVGTTSSKDGDDVTVVVPKAFTFTTDDHKQVKYGIGIQDMPRAHAEHWFSKAHGVEIKE